MHEWWIRALTCTTSNAQVDCLPVSYGYESLLCYQALAFSASLSPFTHSHTPSLFHAHTHSHTHTTESKCHAFFSWRGQRGTRSAALWKEKINNKSNAQVLRVHCSFRTFWCWKTPELNTLSLLEFLKIIAVLAVFLVLRGGSASFPRLSRQTNHVNWWSLTRLIWPVVRRHRSV